MLRPCPLVDNPGRLSVIVAKTGAHSQRCWKDDVKELSGRCLDFALGCAYCEGSVGNGT